jgi:hypothetical protein
MTRDELTTRLRAIGRTKAEIARVCGYRRGAANQWGIEGRPVPRAIVALVEAWEEIDRLECVIDAVRAAEILDGITGRPAAPMGGP